MVAYPLIFGELTSESYTDEAAKDHRIDALRAKITCVEDKRFSVEYHEPSKRSIGNALLVELNDGTVLDEVEIEYPVGHKRRREEGTPLLLQNGSSRPPLQLLLMRLTPNKRRCDRTFIYGSHSINLGCSTGMNR